MPLNVVIELSKIAETSKLFQRNFYLPLLEPLSPKAALRRHVIASGGQLQKIEHYIPVLEEYEKRQARRRLIEKGQVKKRQKKKASMKYVMPLLDMNMPGHAKLKHIFTRKSTGQGQCYTYRVPDKNCTLVLTHQMERSIRDRDFIDILMDQTNGKVVFVLKNNQNISVPLVNYEGDAPFYRGEGWTKRKIENTHHYGKDHTCIFEEKEQSLEEWEMDMINMTTLRKKKSKYEDMQEWKTLMSTQAKYIDWEQFERQAKQIVQEEYTLVEDRPIAMKVSSMENTMNVNQKLQGAGKSVMELLPTISEVPEILKLIQDEGELIEVANVAGVRVEFMKKDHFVPGQMVRADESNLFVPGQTIFNENGDTEYVPGITVIVESEPTLIPGLVMSNDPNKPIFLPGVSTITESGILEFSRTEDDFPQEVYQSSENEELEEILLSSKQVLEMHSRPIRQVSGSSSIELPNMIKDIETNVKALASEDEDNKVEEKVESEDGDEIEDESEPVVSVIEICPSVSSSIKLPYIIKDTETNVKALASEDDDNKVDDKEESEDGDEIEDESESVVSVIEICPSTISAAVSVMGKETNEHNQEVEEFLVAAKTELAEEMPLIFKQLDEEREKCEKNDPNVKPMVDSKEIEHINEHSVNINQYIKPGDKEVNEKVSDKLEQEGNGEKTESTETEFSLKTEQNERGADQDQNALRNIEPSIEYTQSKNQMRDEHNNPEHIITSKIEAVSSSPTIQPKHVEGLPNEIKNKEGATHNKQYTNVWPQKVQLAQVEEIKYYFVKYQGLKEQTGNMQLQMTKELAKVEKVFKEQDTKRQVGHQDQATIAQEAEELTTKEKETENCFTTDKMTLIKTVPEQTVGEQLVKQAEKIQMVNEYTVKDQTEDRQAMQKQATNEQAVEEPESKMHATKKEPENQAGKNHTSNNETTEEQTTVEHPAKEQASIEQRNTGILEEQNSIEKAAKDEITDDYLAKNRPIKATTEKQVENTGADMEEIKHTYKLPSKDIRHWSSVVKELVEVTVVVVGFYFINKLGKSLFYVHI